MLSEYYDSMNSFTYNGVNSLDMGLFITAQEAADSAAAPVIETVEIPGRGNLIMDNRVDELDNQQFNDYTQKYTCCAAMDQGFDMGETAARIYRWLYAPGIGYGSLYDTYNRDSYREAHVSGNASASDLAARLLGEFDIEFTCRAYRRIITGEKTVTMTEAGTLYNTWGFTSKPYIRITGSGAVTLYINSRAYSFTDINEYIEIDSELMNAYKGDTLQNSKMLSLKFPRLEAGANAISWTGTVSKVEIVPRWCRL